MIYELTFVTIGFFLAIAVHILRQWVKGKRKNEWTFKSNGDLWVFRGKREL